MSDVKMPGPVAYRWAAPIAGEGGGIVGRRQWEYSTIQKGLPWWDRDGLITTDQAEAYAAAKVRESQEWMPIETAPKDGSMILLGRAETEDCGAISVPGYWQEGFDDGVDYMGVGDGFVDVNHQQFSGGRDWGPEKYRYAPNQPTHWRQLPTPPSE